MDFDRGIQAERDADVKKCRPDQTWEDGKFLRKIMLQNEEIL